jgi:hypothetical protein
VVQPRWIGITSVVLLVVSVTTAVLREPSLDAPDQPLAVPAADAASPTPGDHAPRMDASAQHGASTTEPTPAMGRPAAASVEPTSTSNPSTEEATEAPPEPLPFASWGPAPAGRYQYATVGTSGIDGDEHPLPDQTTLRVSDPGRDGFQARVRDLRNEQGYGQLLAYDLHVRDNGIELSRITTATRVRLLGGMTDTRTFAADPPGPLVTTGDHVDSSHQFTMYSGATTIAMTIRIQGIESVSIGGTDVDAVVLEQHLVFDGDIEGTTTARAWLQLGDLLLLREQVDADLTSRDVRHVTSYSAELLSLTPA